MANKIEFGLFSPLAGLAWKAVVQRAAKIEQLGYHSMWLTDHFWNRGVPDADVLECTAAMSALSVATEKLRIGSLVLCNSFRNPGLLAKVLATVDNLSNGRIEIGLGAGWMEEEYRAYNWDFPSAAMRIEQTGSMGIVQQGTQTQQLIHLTPEEQEDHKYAALMAEEAYFCALAERSAQRSRIVASGTE